ncbi:hypothetical protein [Kordiimonas aquimaris]|uniref:hypothetical protein n=1 Tax=Kordiimonas aquimaris TaxID=707591 RepID=UPI0021D2E24F|nr:hypothetical protein [Kordiimonas aquimaris]
MKFTAIMILIVTLVSEPAQTQDISMSHIIGETPYESPSCTSTDHHEMDFMHGIWDMKVLVDERWVEGGFSVHRSALGGCASLEFVSYENWGEIFAPLTGRNGLAEITVSTYDTKEKNWRQVWVDDTGTVVTSFRGKRFADSMRFVGHAPHDNGSELQRMIWKITGDGLREMTLDQSTDGGQEWTRMATVQMVLRQ